MKVKTKAWPDVVEFYRELNDLPAFKFEPMLSLVRFLASSKYAGGLFPCTSMHDLVLARVPDFAWGYEDLRIQFDGEAQEFKFTYRQRPDDVEPWTRTCHANEWPRVLERILQKRLQWFHEG